MGWGHPGLPITPKSWKRLTGIQAWVVRGLEERGVTWVSLNESLDASTPGGKLIFRIFGALAEFEHKLIRERTMAGLAAARARGRVGGRPTVWTEAKLKTARSMYDSREHDVSTIARIASRVLGVSRASVYWALGPPPSTNDGPSDTSALAS